MVVSSDGTVQISTVMTSSEDWLRIDKVMAEQCEVAAGNGKEWLRDVSQW